jgi:hypothetical protein
MNEGYTAPRESSENLGDILVQSLKARVSPEAWKQFEIACDFTKPAEVSEQAAADFNAMGSAQLVDGYQNNRTLDQRIEQKATKRTGMNRLVTITELPNGRFTVAVDTTGAVIDMPSHPREIAPEDRLPEDLAA